MDELDEFLTALEKSEGERRSMVHDYLYMTCSICEKRIEEDSDRTLREKLNKTFTSIFDDAEPGIATRIVQLLEDDELPLFLECALKATTEEFLRSLKSMRMQKKLNEELAVKSTTKIKRIKI